MRPAPFTYKRATSLEEAVRASAAGSTPLAGGQSLLAAMKLRQIRPEGLVDLGPLTELTGIEVGTAEVKIGALTRHREVASHGRLLETVPWLCEAAGLIGDVQVRNLGSLGGNLCFADPRANLPPVLLALGARAEVLTDNGSRTVPLAELFRGFRQNALAAGEILTSVSFPVGPDLRGAYLEISPQPQGVPLVNVSVCLGGSPGVAVGGLAPTPLQLPAVAEAISQGMDASLAAYDASDFAPVEDLQADANYRIKAGRVLLRRAIEKARG